ncbi:MAG: ABC transporter permease [Acidimicrobiales bacterium]
MKRVGPPLATFAAAIGVWLAVSYVVLEPSRRFLLPPPQDVMRVGFLNWHNLHEILTGLALTSRVVAVGWGIAFIIGVGLAIAMSQAKWIERSIYPYAVVLQTVPILAITPLLGFVFGFNFTSRVLVCVLLALFPIVTNTLFGLLSADQLHHDLFSLHRASRVTRLWKLQLPAALPAMFTGLRISAGLAVIGAVVGDFFFKQGRPGIGILIDLYRSRLQSEQLYAAVIASSLLGVAAFLLVGAVGRLVVGRWHEPPRG